MALQKMYCCACFIVLLCISCNCGTVGELVNNGDGNKRIKGDDSLYYLDISKPSITQPIEPKNGALAGYKFVQIEVTEVLNPKKYPLTFEVRYQSKDNVKTYLGSFSLYPADNPGKFIVATQGKLKGAEAIILSMVIPDKIDPGDTVRVAVKKIKFLQS